ncbi:B3 domain-containing protein [Cephalotus follicularis]|uniref:B3 domain-containing protein n=1 Tax=Cephalotus follicularis TaxID=3775 RepID=A0A1Q3DFU3_CEPFO|nr:B3 domain-containing protein [Cephalotus follicularis]
MRDDDRFLFTAKTPHFFKVILDDTIRDGKLEIPRRFVRKYGNDLPNSVLLKVPSGAVWRVELSKCNGEVWLQNGWQEFKEYYSIALNHFLVFKYEGNSCFSVVIFDMSASEIKYPYHIAHCDGDFKQPNMEETEDDVSVEILDDIVPGLKRRERSPLAWPQPHKLMRTHAATKIGRTSKSRTFVAELKPEVTHSGGEELEDSKRNIKSQCHTQLLGGMISEMFLILFSIMRTTTGQRGRQSKILGRQQTLTGSKKAKLIQVASSFKSNKPFFMVTMKPSYVGFGHVLCVPAAFARKYFLKEHGNVILRLSDSRTWSAKYWRGASNSKTNAKITCGWRAFALDNHLDVGDTCIFELMQGSEMSLEVSIFRVVQDAKNNLSPASKFCGISLWKCSLVNKIDSDYTDNGDTGILKSLDQLITCQDSQLPHEHNVEHGKQCSQRPSSSRVSKALSTACKFKSEYPFVKLAIQPSHVKYGNVCFPLKFIEKLIKQIGEPKVTLQVADRSWPVKLLLYPSYSHGKLGNGWSTFARENFLRVGDMCVFEIIKRDDVVLKVSIFRGAG